MNKYVIETNIPMPIARRDQKGTGLKGCLLKMNVGDSVFLPGKTMHYASGAIGNAKKQIRLDGGDANYSARTVEGGVRIWRVA